MDKSYAGQNESCVFPKCIGTGFSTLIKKLFTGEIINGICLNCNVKFGNSI